MRPASISRALHLAVALTAIAGCAAAPTKPLTELETTQRNGGDPRLINEGGPVFAMPGELVLPTYYQGTTDGLTVTAERISGTTLRNIDPATVGPDAGFTLRVPGSSEIFFATVVVNHEDKLHRIRSLVRPDGDARITIDAASTLVAAKIMLARERNRMAQLAGIYDDTAELTDYTRGTLSPSALGAVRLDQTNRELSVTFDGLAAGHPDLEYKLHAWEELLNATRKPGEAAPTPVAPDVPDVPLAGPQPK